jgi:hypothetical protein
MAKKKSGSMPVWLVRDTTHNGCLHVSPVRPTGHCAGRWTYNSLPTVAECHLLLDRLLRDAGLTMRAGDEPVELELRLKGEK